MLPHTACHCFMTSTSFLEGLYCSIHGTVLGEMIDVFFFSGNQHSTLWHHESYPEGRKLLSQYEINFSAVKVCGISLYKLWWVIRDNYNILCFEEASLTNNSYVMIPCLVLGFSFNNPCLLGVAFFHPWRVILLNLFIWNCTSKSTS